MNMLKLFDHLPIKVIYKSESIAKSDWSIKEGVTHFLIGDNGIGKTSLVRSFKRVSKKFQVSYLDQFPLSPLSHLTVNDARSILSNGLDRFENSKFESYCDDFNFRVHLDKHVQHLSGGENQILKILIALSTKADLYIFDEPFSFLSLENQSKLEKIIKEIDETVLIIDHELSRVDRLSDIKWLLKKNEGELVLYQEVSNA